MNKNDNPQSQDPVEANNSAGAGCMARLLPIVLWLQWHGTPEDDGEVCESEVTWCREKIFDQDVEYVHADEIRRALMGHRRSELWGEKGLIAATMRCVDAIGRIDEAIVDADGTAEETVARIRGIIRLDHVSPPAASVAHGKDPES